MTNRAQQLLEQESRASERKIFGAPIVWPDESGLTIRNGADIPLKAIPVPADDDPLLIAARKAFPTSHKSKHAQIVHRYRDAYVGIPEADAIRAILKGYSSPGDAMRARQLMSRPLKGESS